MYSRVCLLCIIVTLSLGYVASKPGVEENDKIFSVPLEVIHPRDIDCEISKNVSRCEVELSNGNSANVQNFQGGLMSIMEIGIDKQTFKVQLDTGSEILWVFGDNCSDENKKCSGHTKYKLDKKIKYKDFKIGYASGAVIISKVEDTVQLTKDIIIEKQLFGAASDTTMDFAWYDGVIGLNTNTKSGWPSVIYSMIYNKLIKEPVYSMNLIGGTTSKKGGEITFGGHNDKLIKGGHGISVRMARGGKTITQMTGLNVGKHVFCGKKRDECTVLIDSGASYILGPADFADFMDKVLRAKRDNQVNCKSINKFPVIEIMFGKQMMSLEPQLYTYMSKRKCYSLIYANPSKLSHWAFGLPFFHKYYTQFDFTDNREEMTFWEKP
ncbi:hypothetical protein LOD99_9263 [Oopsacas minuta]|uniref:Peptidase A1 domain-containing protein n=1 Tax=Oopsacas minuta TaxID=111878 RepID=A0AAV7JCB1_9METZ|nr:hypothetical protein LOD99_9263 [Oopsacas minuta]